MEKAHQRKIREEQARYDSPLAEWHDIDTSIQNGIVHEIDFDVAKPIILKYEWLGKLRAGMLHAFGIFFDGVIGGVVIYANDYSENLGTWDGYGYTGKIICLARGTCVHWAHEHTGSKLIRQSMKMLPDKYKIISCTVDENAGEIGTIYQACGFNYVGIMGPGKRVVFIKPNGNQISERTARDLYGTGNIKLLEEKGLKAEYVKRKARYFAFRGSKKEQKELRKAIESQIKPYPKRQRHSDDELQQLCDQPEPSSHDAPASHEDE